MALGMTLQSHDSGLFSPLLIHLQREGFNDDKIVCVLLLDPPELGATCCRCQLRKTLHWCVEEVDGCWGTVCSCCGEVLLSQLKARGGLHV